jgi:hypothetical protein
MSTYATCYEESTGRLAGSHKARTAVLVSPEGKFRAYAESEAAASTTNDGTVPECQNISKLYVAGAAGQEFHMVLELKPDSETFGNSFDLIDWSSQGHRLLVAQGIWQWGSELVRWWREFTMLTPRRYPTTALSKTHFRAGSGRVVLAYFTP